MRIMCRADASCLAMNYQSLPPQAKRGGDAGEGPASDLGATLKERRSFRLPLVISGTSVHKKMPTPLGLPHKKIPAPLRLPRS